MSHSSLGFLKECQMLLTFKLLLQHHQCNHFSPLLPLSFFFLISTSYIYIFWHKVSLCSWPETHCIKQADLKLTETYLSASDSQVLGSKVCATALSANVILFFKIFILKMFSHRIYWSHTFSYPSSSLLFNPLNFMFFSFL